MSALSLPNSTSTARQAFPTQPTIRSSADAQSTLANRLANRLGMDPSALSGKKEDYTPDKVSDRLLGFIEGRLKSESASGADSEKMQKLLTQARDGIEKGFSEARKILDGMGLLKGQVAEDIDTTYNKIQAGLDNLEKAYGGGSAASVPDTASISSAAYSERSTAKAQTFDLQVTTKEGDKLRISIAQASSEWSKSASVGDGQNSATASRSGNLQIGAWNVSVEGDLSDDEKASLKDLLNQVQDISNKFYSGDLSGAFDRAMDLQLDGTQLASMSLNLTQSSVRKATDAYSDVAQQGVDPSQGSGAASAVNGSLREYAQNLLDAMNTANDFAEDGKSTLQDLLKGGFSLDERFDQSLLDKADTLNGSLLDGLQKLFPTDTAKASGSLS
ncbi:DUF5610 domain-containing protein [Pseudomonas sp. RIT-PI-AD]|uniref:DUF5610 domain-containing protein n=1 Tax=Pseudomonas sp. RIT-PI-AD TaxID=3035294 RepID=UPI0021D9E2C7|nr:DUF5610 domain-containing protein [Pseudomonas sp. RIT-PI-AD]